MLTNQEAEESYEERADEEKAAEDLRDNKFVASNNSTEVGT